MNPHDPKGAAGKLKCPLHLIPTAALESEAWVLQHGADKYSENNWRESGVCVSTYVAATLRHLLAWRDGQDMDLDSGQSHLGHIRANMGILLDAAKVGTLQDDRPVMKNVTEESDCPDCSTSPCDCGPPTTSDAVATEPLMSGFERRLVRHLSVPPGNNGWTARASLCAKIARQVTYKSGVAVYPETVDDVISFLCELGHLSILPNATGDARNPN